MREWGQQQSSNAIFRMVSRLAANCPKDSQITAPSLLLRLQPSPWHWTIIGTWILCNTLDSMSCLQAIESEDTENPLICHIMNLLWALSDKGTHVRFCWVPSHCGIEGNEIVDQLAKETFDHDRPTDKSSLCRFEACREFLYPTGGSNQVGCVYTW